MRYVALVIFLILAYIITSFYVLSTYRLYGTSMKAVLNTYLSYPGVLSDDWEISGDEETGLSHIHVECSTWSSMGTFLLDMVAEANKLAKTINKQTQELIDHFSSFLFEVEVVLDDFRNKVDQFVVTIKGQPGDADKIMIECCDYLSEMYGAIQQKARYTGVGIVSNSRLYMHKVHDQMTMMFQGLYEKVVRNATASSIRECTCHLLIRVNELQKDHLPKVKNCAEDYTMESIRALNGTAYELLNASEKTMDTLSESRKTMNVFDLNVFLPNEVS